MSLSQFALIPFLHALALAAIFGAVVFFVLRKNLSVCATLLFSLAASFTSTAYALTLSVIQFSVWGQSAESQMFLTAPLSLEVPASPVLRFVIELIGAHEYFLYYAWGHFIMPIFLIILASFIWYAALRAAQYFRSSTLKSGEPEFALLATLVAPWPYALFVVPAAFLIMLAMLIVRRGKEVQFFHIPLIISGTLFLLLHFVVN